MDKAKPQELDESLWVRLDGNDGRCFILGNCHTHQGRMSGWSESLTTSFCFSKNEVIEASDRASAWIDGFLAGSEPEPEDMFGPEMLDVDDSDVRLERWRGALADYRKTGYWPHAPWGPLIPFPEGARLPNYVWALRGPDIWTWGEAGWRVAEPQPSRGYGHLEGTICCERGHHDMSCVTTAHLVCMDCGRTDICVPDGMTWAEFEGAQYSYKPEPILGEE